MRRWAGCGGNGRGSGPLRDSRRSGGGSAAPSTAAMAVAARSGSGGDLGAGKVHVNDSVWRPAAWLKTKRAFRPLAEHLSYSAEKSAAVTAGCCRGRGFSTAHVPSPLTMLAHVGARGGLWERGWDSCILAGAAGSPAALQMGEARWRGARLGDRTASCNPPPAPARGGEVGGWSRVRVEE